MRAVPGRFRDCIGMLSHPIADITSGSQELCKVDDVTRKRMPDLDSDLRNFCFRTSLDNLSDIRGEREDKSRTVQVGENLIDLFSRAQSRPNAR